MLIARLPGAKTHPAGSYVLLRPPHVLDLVEEEDCARLGVTMKEEGLLTVPVWVGAVIHAAAAAVFRGTELESVQASWEFLTHVHTDHPSVKRALRFLKDEERPGALAALCAVAGPLDVIATVFPLLVEPE